MALLAQPAGTSPATGRLRVVAEETDRRPDPGPLGTPGRRATALTLLLAAATTLYTVGLTASGWANSYYAAAAQAGAQSWRAMLFGGLDPSGGITVDKPPAALWLIDVSVRLFGLSPLAILVPQAVAGVASVALLYATVRRQALALDPRPETRRRAASVRHPSGGREARAAAIGLLAAAALAVTPVATLMARYDNPDELMLLLLVGAAYALTRSIGQPSGGGAWLALSGALLGFAFLTKMLQAWLVLPAFLVVAALAGAGSLGRRLARSGLAGGVMLASAGWWIAVVQLTPATQRPWVGGTQGNNVLELALGYNGIGRLTGQEAGGGASDVPRPGSLLRLVGAWGTEAGWLLPAAAVALLVAAVLTRGRDRRDPLRAGLLLWGAWLVVVALVLGSLHGIAHGYYTVQLAPAIAGSLALGAGVLWQHSWGAAGVRWPRVLLILGLLGNAAWGTLLMVHRHSSPPVVVIGVVAATAIVGALAVASTSAVVRRAARLDDLGVARLRLGRQPGRTRAVVLATAVTGLLLFPAAWSVTTAQAAHRGPNVASGVGPAAYLTPPDVSPGSAPGDGFDRTISAEVRAAAAGSRWAAAVVGHRAADLQLSSGAPVLALGGYSGNDPHPTVPEFLAAVAHGQVRYLVVDSADARAGGDAGRIVRWALGCMPVRHTPHWMVIDLADAALATRCLAR
ncbi:MAG TPA: glycosyltransferase family 39 protein [Blastococcus sp.]|jgi:4-amino-4-deoxy-L-arabinose transferase-like glycosyltransferase|nr:glycosyltransferase family 39 protein [Blastococcus sp.]